MSCVRIKAATVHVQRHSPVKFVKGNALQGVPSEEPDDGRRHDDSSEALLSPNFIPNGKYDYIAGKTTIYFANMNGIFGQFYMSRVSLPDARGFNLSTLSERLQLLEFNTLSLTFHYFDCRLSWRYVLLFASLTEKKIAFN
jgi:hypothetical protein